MVSAGAVKAVEGEYSRNPRPLQAPFPRAPHPAGGKSALPRRRARRGRVCAKASFPAKSLREEPRAARMSHQAEVIFSFSRMRSLIMAMNSELVGFPLALLTV